jgi:hypothetical protein
MLEIFVDTSGWGNLVDKSQPYQKSVQKKRSLEGIS